MTLTLYGEVRIAGDEARGKIDQLKASQAGLKDSARDVSTEGRKATVETTRLGNAAATAAGRVDTLGDMEKEAAIAARNLGQSHQIASGQLGTLTAQFNDIGVMLAAGQNPLQLAIQQGTQITQVIGPLGAQGAVKALGSAFLSLISPINLVTLGVIAGGAALVQWLTDAGEEAGSLEENLNLASSAIQAFGEKSERAKLSVSGMFAEFGSASPELRAVLVDMAALGKIDAYRAIDQTAESLKELVETGRFRNAGANVTEFLGLGSIGSAAREARFEFGQLLESLIRSEEPAQKLGAALDLRDIILETSGGVENLSGRQREFYEGLAATIRDLITLGAQVEQVNTRNQDQQSEEIQSAREMLATLQQENAIRQATITYGRDSAEVAALRADAERQAFEETLASLEVSESLKEELRAAFEEGLGLSQVDLSSGIGAGANEAARLAENLGISLETARILAALGPQGGSSRDENGNLYSGRGGDPRLSGGSALDIQTAEATDFLANYREPRASTGGGGRAAAHDAEAAAIERLIERQQQQLDILRESDPVHQEMLRYRDLMRGATEEQRVALETLIGTRLREQEAMQGVADQQSFFKDIARDSISGVFSDVENLGDAFDRLAQRIADAALEAALFGEGPLAGLFGGGGGGGLFGFITDALIPGKAEGGYLTGPGSGTSDNLPIMASSGEFVINAKSTARHRPLLEAINSGSPISGYAAGGIVAPPVSVGGNASGRPQGAQDQMMITIAPGPEFDARVQSTSQNVALEVVREYDASVLPASVQRISDDPRVTS